MVTNNLVNFDSCKGSIYQQKVGCKIRIYTRMDKSKSICHLKGIKSKMIWIISLNFIASEKF